MATKRKQAEEPAPREFGSLQVVKASARRPIRKTKASGSAPTESAVKTKPSRKVAEGDSTPKSGPVFVDGLLYFSPYDLARYQLAEHKLANCLQGVRLKRFELAEETVRHNTAVKVMQYDINSLTAEAANLQNALTALRDDLQVHYPIRFDEISYDDVTGRITIHGKPES